jgi:hypothetical protein
VLGIYLMWFAVLVSGIGALGLAAAFAYRPDDRKLALLRPVSLASIFAALGSLTAGWATVLQGAAATSTWSAGSVQRLLMGSSETLVPVFVTFGLLSVAWLIAAIGMMRQE